MANLEKPLRPTQPDHLGPRLSHARGKWYQKVSTSSPIIRNVSGHKHTFVCVWFWKGGPVCAAWKMWTPINLWLSAIWNIQGNGAWESEPERKRKSAKPGARKHENTSGSYLYQGRASGVCVQGFLAAYAMLLTMPLSEIPHVAPIP